MSKRLTVSEACKFTGKSESTIKRMLREIVADPAHPERRLIDPPHDEVERRKAAGDSYMWHIDTELLLKRYPPATASDESKPSGQSDSALQGVVVEVLQEQLRSKDEQIRTLETQLDRKDDQIADLNERQRESNILMKALQERLTIAPPASDTEEKTPWWKRRLF